jgi:hypothetical protein
MDKLLNVLGGNVGPSGATRSRLAPFPDVPGAFGIPRFRGRQLMSRQLPPRTGSRNLSAEPLSADRDLPRGTH